MAGVSKEKKPRLSDPHLSELLERAEVVKRTSEDLVRQMKELASQIAETKAIAADTVAKCRRK